MKKILHQFYYFFFLYSFFLIL